MPAVFPRGRRTKGRDCAGTVCFNVSTRAWAGEMLRTLAMLMFRSASLARRLISSSSSGRHRASSSFPPSPTLFLSLVFAPDISQSQSGRPQDPVPQHSETPMPRAMTVQELSNFLALPTDAASSNARELLEKRQLEAGKSKEGSNRLSKRLSTVCHHHRCQTKVVKNSNSPFPQALAFPFQ
jgi:hypothetical protein